MGLAFSCALMGPLASASVFDLQERRIPNKLVLCMVVLWIVVMGAHLVSEGGSQAAWHQAGEGLGAALVLGGAALVLGCLFERAFGQTAIGGGDIKLLFAMGLYLGFIEGALCLLVACAASVVLAFVIPRTRFANAPGACAGQVPFAPALFLGAMVALIL